MTDKYGKNYFVNREFTFFKNSFTSHVPRRMGGGGRGVTGHQAKHWCSPIYKGFLTLFLSHAM